MLSHARIWAAIDRLAERHAMSPSGLARRAGLDPTTFNKSKRIASDGRPRWPSTESIAKILQATGEELEQFLEIVRAAPRGGAALMRNIEASFGRGMGQVPVIGFAQAGAGGFFDDGGFPAGQGWDEIAFPGLEGEAVYALQVSGESMQPLYRDGDTIIVSRSAVCRKGDRVVIKTRDGEVMAKILEKQTKDQIELVSLNPLHPNRMFAPGDIEWMARIIWASQ